jgi:CheY-like chemotaxis protein
LEKSRKTILIADDDPEDQEMLEEAFLKAGANVKSEKVDNGQEALDYLEKMVNDDLPCAIILDYSMPLLTGAQVLTAICKDPRFSAIPKFVWSTSNAKTHIKECMDNGATKYFVKPDSMQGLIGLATEILAACDG